MLSLSECTSPAPDGRENHCSKFRSQIFANATTTAYGKYCNVLLRCGSLEPLVVKVFSCESLWLSLVVKVSTADICLVSAQHRHLSRATADICHVSTQQTSFLSQLRKTTTMQSSIHSRAQVVIIFESPQSLKCISC